MNTQFKVRFLQHLNNKKANKGFTLIELLVVVIIIGVLAAIALPNLLGQVAKGRQSEAKNGLGSINRAQQAYRLEDATFTVLSNLPVKIGVVNGTGFDAQYYTFTGGTNDALSATHGAAALTTYTNDILNYTSGVSQTAAGVYTAAVCEQTGAANGTDPAVPALASGVMTCATSTKTVK